MASLEWMRAMPAASCDCCNKTKGKHSVAQCDGGQSCDAVDRWAEPCPALPTRGSQHLLPGRLPKHTAAPTSLAIAPVAWHMHVSGTARQALRYGGCASAPSRACGGASLRATRGRGGGGGGGGGGGAPRPQLAAKRGSMERVRVRAWWANGVPTLT